MIKLPPIDHFDFMNYESPIEVYVKKMQTELVEQLDDGILAAVAETGISVNEDELVKALKYDRGQYEKGYADGFANADKEVVYDIFKELDVLVDDYQYSFISPLEFATRVADLKKKYFGEEE